MTAPAGRSGSTCMVVRHTVSLQKEYAWWLTSSRMWRQGCDADVAAIVSAAVAVVSATAADIARA